ncbi:MAG TPA: hypothetical protein VGE88_00155, partial [Lysobacter sp.]
MRAAKAARVRFSCRIARRFTVIPAKAGTHFDVASSLVIPAKAGPKPGTHGHSRGGDSTITVIPAKAGTHLASAVAVIPAKAGTQARNVWHSIDGSKPHRHSSESWSTVTVTVTVIPAKAGTQARNVWHSIDGSKPH